MSERNTRKTLQGEVVSNKMEKTLVVKVTKKMPHPRYKKLVHTYKKYYAHAERQYQEGDLVTIVETRPLSKRKRWRVEEPKAPAPKAAST
ncbi:MAG: 30S ribosomal protein S17 [Chlamydiota bacterium]